MALTELKENTAIRCGAIEYVFNKSHSATKQIQTTETQLQVIAQKTDNDFNQMVQELPEIALKHLKPPPVIDIRLGMVSDDIRQETCVHLNDTNYNTPEQVSFSYYGYWHPGFSSEISCPTRHLTFERIIPCNEAGRHHTVSLVTSTAEADYEYTSERIPSENINQRLKVELGDPQGATKPELTFTLKGKNAGQVTLIAGNYDSAIAAIDDVFPDLKIAKSIQKHTERYIPAPLKEWIIEFNTPKDAEKIIQNLMSVVINGNLLAQ